MASAKRNRSKGIVSWPQEERPRERLVKECVEAAERLLADVRAWLKKNRPDLI